jgi:alkylation response protein AidB-like acyl-CoA dehydrogenase
LVCFSSCRRKDIVFDRSINKYALLPPGTKIDITAAINNKFGYDYIKSEAAANKVLKETGYNEFDISRIREMGTRPFDTNNLLLNNVRYAKENDTVFIIAEQRGKS